jgi:hypothetical protein
VILESIFQQHAKSGLTKPEFSKNNNVILSTFHALAKKLSTHSFPKKQKFVPPVFPEIKPEL